MQNLIVNGNLHCTKQECAKLAAIQIRIIELSYIKKFEEERVKKELEDQNEATSSSTTSDSSNVNVNDNDKKQSIIEMTQELVKIKTEQEKQEDLKLRTEFVAPTEIRNIDTIKEENECERSNFQKLDEKSIKQSENLDNNKLFVIILTNGQYESLKLYLESCSCLNKQKTAKTLDLKNLVHPNYKRSRDIIKLIENEKELLSKDQTSIYNNEIKLKEYFVDLCTRLNCFDSKLYEVKEVIYNEKEQNNQSAEPFKLVKRHLAIKHNRISLIDYKTKELIRTEKMTDLKSWFSGENYYDLTPFFFQNSSNNGGGGGGATGSSSRRNDSSSSSFDDAMVMMLKQQSDLINSSKLKKFMNFFNKNKINPNKNFLIHFRSMKWQLQIDDDESLKSITCILLDQSLDIGIDSNPLMLDLTITDQFQNKYKLFSSSSGSYNQNIRNSTVCYQFNQHHQSQISNFYSKKRLTTVTRNSQKKSVFSSNSQKSRNDHSPSFSNLNNQQQQPQQPQQTDQTEQSIEDRHKSTANNKSQYPNPTSHYESTSNMIMNNNNNNTNNNFFMTSSSSVKPAKYESEFLELQLILLWFPEEVAFRLTDVEYELFKEVHPSEYLRYASLNINNIKSALLAETNNKLLTTNADPPEQTTSNQETSTTTTTIKPIKLNNVSTKTVEDLLVRYKEVSSWIKKLIQSQPTGEKRLAIIFSAIRCSITCWNIGNFNSSREIWLGLKYQNLTLLYFSFLFHQLIQKLN
jgi:hypothetical protein